MRKITSAKDLCLRIKKRADRYFIRPVYIKREENAGHGGLRAVHITYYRAKNLGDTVLSQCVRRTLTMLCNITKYRLIEVSEPVTDALINEMNKADIVVIGGGGLFLPDTNKNSVSGWQWAVSEKDLEKINKPVILYSVGYNYFRGQSVNTLFEENLRLIIGKSSFAGLRNMGSCRSVCDLLDNDDDKRKISFQPCTTTLIREIYPGLPKKKKTGNIALNIAFDREQLRFGDNKELILSNIAKAMKNIEKRGYRIYYIAHCTEDLKFLPYLDEEKVRYKAVDMSMWYPVRALKLYNRMDMVLGMRGHAQMIPFGLGCEIISLGTHEKLKWFLEDIEASDWYIELADDPGKLAAKITHSFIRIHEEEADLTEHRLKAASERLWEITEENAKVLNEILSEGMQEHS